jgi:enoyl-CoA hydratase/carnithine racemase
MELLLTGREIDAQTAVAWGLVNRAVPADQLDDEIAAWIDEIVAFSGPVIGLGKEAFHRQIGLDETGAYKLAKDVMVLNAEMADAQEGMGAFLEKRRPEWRNPS